MLRVSRLSKDYPTRSGPLPVLRDVNLELLDSLRGRVWKRVIDRSQLEGVEREHRVISTKLLAGRTLVHVYDDSTPGAEWHEVEPDLEDVYFSTMAAAA